MPQRGSVTETPEAAPAPSSWRASVVRTTRWATACSWLRSPVPLGPPRDPHGRPAERWMWLCGLHYWGCLRTCRGRRVRERVRAAAAGAGAVEACVLWRLNCTAQLNGLMKSERRRVKYNTMWEMGVAKRRGRREEGGGRGTWRASTSSSGAMKIRVGGTGGLGLLYTVRLLGF